MAVAVNATVKCAKCGVTSKEDPTLTFHRFPLPSMHGSLKAKVWATFCFPEESWTSDESLVKLHKQHKVLCGKHFDSSSFTSDDRKRLNKFAIPNDAEAILARLRSEQPNPFQQSDDAMLAETEASTSQNIFSVCTEDSNILNPERPTLTKENRRNVKTKMELTSKKLKMHKRSRGNLTEIRLRSKLKAVKKSTESVPRTLTNEDSVNKLKLTGPLVCAFSINQDIKDTIKKITKERLPDDNRCILAFNEMSINEKHTYYNGMLDKLDGSQDHANEGGTPEITIQALTFWAIGLRKLWKQPIACFPADHVTADRLAVVIKEVLDACFGAGLQVMGTVCDLDGVNLRAINLLGSSRDQPFFDFQGHEIVTILDPPHLLKRFRNSFLKHDIEFTLDLQTEEQQVRGVAKWSHIEKFFEIDHLNPDFVFAPALTKEHIQPNRQQKMNVSLAAQVLSHSVAAGMFARCSRNELPPEAVSTANVVAIMDKLFDAMNGDTPDSERGKALRRNMTSSSPHLEFFAKMKRFFATMKFIGARNRPPSQDGWLRTLHAIERIFRNLKQCHIKKISLKRLSLDPLENCS